MPQYESPHADDWTASPATRDGFVRLAAAICTRAFLDWASNDPISRLDALLFLIGPDVGVYLHAAGFDVDPLDLLRDQSKQRRLKQVLGRQYAAEI